MSFATASERRALAAAIALVLVVAPNIANAEPSPAAEALFREGQTLLDAGQVHEACAKLEESLRLDPALGTLLNLAVCHEREGRTATAWAEHSQAAARAARNQQPEREKFALEHARALEARLSRIALIVSAPLPDLSISLDEKPIGAQAWDVAIPVDPGEHTIVVSAPNKRTLSLVVAVPTGPTVVRVTVGQLEDVKSTSPAPPPPRPEDTQPTSTPPPPDRPIATTRWIGFGAVGLGVVALGVGSVFGLRALDQKGERDEHCDATGCDPEGLVLQRDARTSATIATVGFALGIGLVAIGTTAILITPTTGGATIAGTARW